MQKLYCVTLCVHCLPCNFGKHLFQISAKLKYTAHTDQLYFGYESVNHSFNIQMQNILHFVTVFIVSDADYPVPLWSCSFLTSDVDSPLRCVSNVS